MVQRYFDKFPTIAYANNVAVNITERAAILNSAFNNPMLYYDYDISNGERPDQIADDYYNDQYMSWVIYLSNKIVDPYHDMFLNNEVFDSYLKKKYNRNDIEKLANQTMYYRNNWFSAEEITVEEYELLESNHFKYWQPVYSKMGRIVSYERTKNDWTVTTNSIVRYEIDGSSFIKTENVNIVFDNTYTGSGQVVLANTSSLTIQHTSGYTLEEEGGTITGSSYIYGKESKSNNIFTSATLVARNIPLDENIYWSPVTIYDYETEVNRDKAMINVMNSDYAMKIASELKKVLK